MLRAARPGPAGAPALMAAAAAAAAADFPDFPAQGLSANSRVGQVLLETLRDTPHMFLQHVHIDASRLQQPRCGGQPRRFLLNLL